MALTISVGSGKGGTGKSVILANLAILLAKQNKKVCIIDLDTGGANAHIMFGLFEPKRCITDFLNRSVATLDEVTYTLDSFYGIQIIPGTGETLQSANMTYQEKQRLLRAVRQIDADIIFIDVGAGANYHTLDFFLAADLQICVTIPEPTSIMAMFRFIQLATIRRALNSFLSQSDVARKIKNRNFATTAEILEAAEKVQPGSREKIERELQNFHPFLVINRVMNGSKLNTMKLKKLVSNYLGIYLPDLGEVPADPIVQDALLAYIPVCEYSSSAPATKALEAIAEKLTKVTSLFGESALKN